MFPIGKKHVYRVIANSIHVINKLTKDWLCFYCFEFIISGTAVTHHISQTLLNFEMPISKAFFLGFIALALLTHFITKE